ncbi:hypothetical protein SKAU_G00117180 [Synaphobranchus kaupii]|uniref:Uncharacterized protein n=1 Tax=Synaphobranchus kaupii TaxID=118154 RepID=A0A9Q1FMZ0_SYNKA|nr:hypothetical protein SKAU_G00117180 [Synaphobranchus kaupii]
MHVMVKSLKLRSVVQEKWVLTDKEKKMMEKFCCTFYGDYTLEQNPTSYEEAVLLYKQLPKLLGEDKRKAVPVRVWLYPLKNLNPIAAQLSRPASRAAVSAVYRRCDLTVPITTETPRPLKPATVLSYALERIPQSCGIEARTGSPWRALVSQGNVVK